MFREIDNKKIPLVLLNARLTKKTFKRWMKIKSFTKSVFNKIKIAYPQNLETKFFLKKLNATKINLIGNLKFIENQKEEQNKINSNLKIQLKTKKVWVASSTHADEELFCAKAHMELKKKLKI